IRGPGAPPSGTGAPSTGSRAGTIRRLVPSAACAAVGHALAPTAASLSLGRSRSMTYVVTENCITCKYLDCVEVCPVDCFYEGENFLVISPDECIDCGVCEPECPVDAIKPDTEDDPDGRWLKINTEYARV